MSSITIGAIVVVSAVLSATLLLALLPWLREHAMVRPNLRSSHRHPTPQGGGAAVIAATIVTAAGAAFLTSGLGPVWLVLVAAALIAAMGAWDDLRSIEVVPRLAVQAVA